MRKCMVILPGKSTGCNNEVAARRGSNVFRFKDSNQTVEATVV